MFDVVVLLCHKCCGTHSTSSVVPLGLFSSASRYCMHIGHCKARFYEKTSHVLYCDICDMNNSN
jgi:hypothetical protein